MHNNMNVNVSGPVQAPAMQSYQTIVLKYNIVDGHNLLTQEMMSQEDTIYVIKWDFELTESIAIPANCVLEFDGGSISGAYTVTGNNTGINASLVKIFDTDVTLTGSWNVVEAYPEWFVDNIGINTDYTDAILKANDICSCVVFSDKVYKTNKLVFSKDIHLLGLSSNATLTPFDTITEGNYIEFNCRNFFVENMLFIGNGDDNNTLNGLVFNGVLNIEQAKRQITRIRIKYFGGVAFTQNLTVVEGQTYRPNAMCVDVKINDCGYGMLITADDCVYSNILVGGTKGYGIRVTGRDNNFYSLYSYANGQEENGYGVELINTFGLSISGLRIQEAFRGGLLVQNSYSNNIEGDIDNCYSKDNLLDNTAIKLIGSSGNKFNIVTTKYHMHDYDMPYLVYGDYLSHMNDINFQMMDSKYNESLANLGNKDLLFKDVELLSNKFVVNNIDFSEGFDYDFNLVKYTFTSPIGATFSKNIIHIPEIQTATSDAVVRLKVETQSFNKTNENLNSIELGCFMLIYSSEQCKLPVRLNAVVNGNNGEQIDRVNVFFLRKGYNFLYTNILNSDIINNIYSGTSTYASYYTQLVILGDNKTSPSLDIKIVKARLSYGNAVNSDINKFSKSVLRATSFSLPIGYYSFINSKNQIFTNGAYIGYIDENNVVWRVASKRNEISDAGNTRPSSDLAYVGLQFYDTTLGKPIWWNGSAWVDATGATV